MRIVELTGYIVHLPLKREIKHASATRRVSPNIVVRCRLADGTEGWGEGVPRSYVTGETPESGLAQLSELSLGGQLTADCYSWSDVIALCDKLRPAVSGDDPRGCGGNALKCAVELSVLDTFGKLFGEPVSRVTQHFALAESIRTRKQRVRYSTAITAEGRRRERRSALKMRIWRFQQCKVKVGLEDDAARLERIRFWIGRKMDLRLDANEAWHAEEVVARLKPLLPYGVTCVEQPLPHAEVDALTEIRSQLGVPIMHDESLTSVADAQRAIQRGTCDLFNIRLSKCGGFLNSLRLAAMAHQAGLGYQLGCHPGESGILSAAGRHWACTVDGIRYLEGSYDRYLLQHRLTHEDLTFGYGGYALSLDGPGLGITINPAALRQMTERQQMFRLGD